MGFMTWCDNKGCRKQMEPVLDKDSNEIICTECNQPINSTTDFMKRQMVSLGQVKRADKPRQAWSVKCQACNREGSPELNSADEKDANNRVVVKLMCGHCKTELTELNKPFAEQVKQNLLTQRKNAVR